MTILFAEQLTIPDIFTGAGCSQYGKKQANLC